ncbi:NUDIX hydrolase domain-like protein [Lipomyces kononenkoae]|uniref:NUDIX hydrolase domain-like protein n=1 Tax=Lipomyces kononenkoae TaxID=34357 RepID=A0ACC3T2J2_LIPKO
MVDPPSFRPYSVKPSVEPFEIPAKTYVSQRAEIFGIVGAAIIIYNNRVLLVQRASDDDCPNLWEVPGGAANGDETIVQCAVRELREEVGLAASDVTDMIGEFEWTERESGSNEHGWRRTWKIFMFRVTIDNAGRNLEIRLDPQEHQAYVWATEANIQEDTCGNIKLKWISTNQKQAILAAFKIDTLSGC